MRKKSSIKVYVSLQSSYHISYNYSRDMSKGLTIVKWCYLNGRVKEREGEDKKEKKGINRQTDR